MVWSWFCCSSFSRAFYICNRDGTGVQVLKWMGLGWFHQPSGYFRDNWNLLDFVIIVSGYNLPINRHFG
jgi:hypothetical protein